jgi:tetratricopeptide (TPR) repeat protein
MKKILTLCLVLIAATSFAQTASKAKQFLKEKNYAEAIKAIDAACADAKQSAKAETWYTRAEVYVAMFEDTNEAVRSQEPKSMDYINEAFVKIAELEKGKGKYTNMLDVTIPGVSVSLKDRLLNALYNAAIANQAEPEAALPYFEKAVTIDPDNYFVGRYLPRFSFYAEDNKKTIQYAEKFAANQAFKDSLHAINEVLQFAVMAAERSDDKAKAKQMTEDAMKKFPKEAFYLNRLINAYINEQKYEDAVTYLKAALELAQDNQTKAMYLSNLALISVELKKIDDAVKYFEETIKFDSNNFAAQFGLGANYYNEGITIENTLTAGELKPDSPKMKQVREKFEKALPYLEKAHAIDDKNAKVFHPLATCYKSLYGEKHEKTKAIQAKLAALSDDE